MKSIFVVFTVLFLWASQSALAQEQSDQEAARLQEQQIRKIATESFQQMHDGWSSDEVVLQDELRDSFVANCEQTVDLSESLADVEDIDWCWTLMNLRKAGKLKAKATKRKTIDTSGVSHVAEIVARSLTDQHQCSIDRLICDTAMRTEFDEAAKTFDADIDCYAVRKAAFQLRKARKLKPELISRIVDWGREITNYSIDEVREKPESLNEHPGIYIFSDSSGYLYIGQTDNLRERLKQHLDESHNLSLAKYLESESGETVSIEVHDFDPKSQAAETRMRRAYESELIASRKPRFNVQP